MRYEIPANAYPSSITALSGGCLYLADLGQEDGLFYAGKTCPLPAEPAGEGDGKRCFPACCKSGKHKRDNRSGNNCRYNSF